jgi:hypothetical protein
MPGWSGNKFNIGLIGLNWVRDDSKAVNAIGQQVAALDDVK